MSNAKAMSTGRRLVIYTRGKGREARLTPKQRRRAEKKMNRNMSRYWVRSKEAVHAVSGAAWPAEPVSDHEETFYEMCTPSEDA